jgi:hypothetical protein
MPLGVWVRHSNGRISPGCRVGTLGTQFLESSPMKMIYRKLSKTASLPVTCHSVDLREYFVRMGWWEVKVSLCFVAIPYCLRRTCCRSYYFVPTPRSTSPGTSRPFAPSKRLSCSSISIHALPRSGSFNRFTSSLRSPPVTHEQHQRRTENFAVQEPPEQAYSKNPPACKLLQVRLGLRVQTSMVLLSLGAVYFLSGGQFHRKSHGRDSFLGGVHNYRHFSSRLHHTAHLRQSLRWIRK